MTKRTRTTHAPVGSPAPATRRRNSLDADRVEARPDGFYWVADDGKQEFGPYVTAAQALAAAREAIEAVVEEEKKLHEAEAEIGVTERIDHDIAGADEQADEGSERP